MIFKTFMFDWTSKEGQEEFTNLLTNAVEIVAKIEGKYFYEVNQFLPIIFFIYFQNL